jgi:hypothetical protein
MARKRSPENAELEPFPRRSKKTSTSKLAVEKILRPAIASFLFRAQASNNNMTILCGNLPEFTGCFDNG